MRTVDTMVLRSRGNPELAHGLVRQRALAVLDEVQENLNEALAVRPDYRKFGLNLPVHNHVIVTERRLNNDPDLFEHGLKIQAGGSFARFD